MPLFRWEDVDHRLVSLRLTDLAEEMHKQIEQDEKRIRFENHGNFNMNTVPSLVLKMKQDRADDMARRVYEIYCDVWQTQGHAKSAAFLRAVYVHGIVPVLRARAGGIASEFAGFAARTGFPVEIGKAHLQSLQRNMLRLEGRWRRRIEIEAKELEHAERREPLSALENELGTPARPSAPERVLPSLSPAQQGPEAKPQGVGGVDTRTQPRSTETGTWGDIYQCSHQWDFTSSEERGLVPNHLTGSRAVQFLEEFLAIKALINAEAQRIWNGCSKVHEMISVAANDEKRRVFSEQYDRWRDQLIGLQEMLIVDRLLPLLAKYQIFVDEQKWLLRACHEVWSPVTAGYLDWLTFVVRGQVHGVGAGAIPEWAWQLPGAPRDVAQLGLSPEKKASAHFRSLADTLKHDLRVYRKGAIAKAFLARKTNESPIVDSGMRRLEPGAAHGPTTMQADQMDRSRVELRPIYSVPLSIFEATVGKLMVQARQGCPTKYLPHCEILKIATLLDDENLPVRSNLEREASRSMAEYNKHHPAVAIKSWKTALSHRQFRRAVRKRFSRAEEKFKKATASVAPSAGTPRTTI